MTLAPLPRAQDQVIDLKPQLLSRTRGLQIFLDLDDLSDTANLRQDVTDTETILVFMSNGYFKRFWCKEELKQAHKEGKKLILVHEGDTRHGGLSLRKAKLQCREPDGLPELADWIFGEDVGGVAERAVIPWCVERARALRGAAWH